MDRKIRCLAFLAALLVGAALLPATGFAEEQEAPILEFARQLHFEGVPFEEVQAFDPDTALAPLIRMLADPAEAEHWGKAVVILGMLGDERAIDPLLEVLRARGEQRVSREQYRAAKTVPVALGYIANLSGSKRALDILTEGLDESSWDALGVGWTTPRHNAADRRRRLTRMAMMGLAVSGRPEAAATLHHAAGLARKSLREPGETATFEDQLLGEHEKVSRLGLACYYDRACKTARR